MCFLYIYWPGSIQFFRQRQLYLRLISFFFVFMRLFSFETQINVRKRKKNEKKRLKSSQLTPKNIKKNQKAAADVS